MNNTFIVNYSKDNFFGNIDVYKSKFLQIVLSFESFCTKNNRSMIKGLNMLWELSELLIVLINQNNYIKI